MVDFNESYLVVMGGGGWWVHRANTRSFWAPWYWGTGNSSSCSWSICNISGLRRLIRYTNTVYISNNIVLFVKRTTVSVLSITKQNLTISINVLPDKFCPVTGFVRCLTMNPTMIYVLRVQSIINYLKVFSQPKKCRLPDNLTCAMLGNSSGIWRPSRLSAIFSYFKTKTQSTHCDFCLQKLWIQPRIDSTRLTP